MVFGSVLASIALPAAAEPGSAKAAAPAAPRSTTTQRLAPEILGGTLGVGVSVALGLITLNSGEKECGQDVEPGAPESYCSSTDAAAIRAVGVLGASLVLVPPAFVTFAGHATGGDGHFGYGLLGALVGLTGGVLVGLPLVGPTDGQSLWILPVSVVTGSIVGYELSATRVRLVANPKERWVGLSGSF